MIGIGSAVAQVVRQAGGEQEALLGHQDHLPPQGVQVDAGDITAVQPELAGGHLHHASEGPHQGGLAAAHRPHHRHQLAGLQPEAHPVEGQPFTVGVADGQAARLQGCTLAIAGLLQRLGLRW